MSFPIRTDLCLSRLRRWLCLLALPLAGCTSWAPQAPELPALHPSTAQTPKAIPAASQQPLSTQEFEAAVVESRRRHRGRREDPVGLPWQSLDLDRLRRMLHMPAFAALDGQTKEPLIDQAGAWNLLLFDSPSQALALWAMLFPNRQSGQPINPKLGTHLPSLHVYRADELWATEAAAMMVMMDCLSRPVWHVYAEDPMLWAMRSNTGWEVPNSFDFGMCVRKSTPTHGPGRWSNTPDTDHGRRIAAVLEDKFSRLLLRQGCDGKGPDSCLHLMYALASLNPRHPQWPAILKNTAPAFTPEQTTTPTTNWLQQVQDRNHHISDTDRNTLIAARAAIARQMIYLGIRLQVLSYSTVTGPENGMGELRATIDQILNQALAQQKLESVYIGQTNLEVVGTSFKPADPWHGFRDTTELPPALQTALQNWARDHALASDCVLPERIFQWVPPVMSLAWSLERMQQGRDTCNALPRQWIAQQYARGHLAPIAKLRPYLHPVQAHRTSIPQTAVKDSAWICTRWTDFTLPPPPDPWKLCGALQPMARPSKKKS